VRKELRTDFTARRVAFYTWVDLGSSYLLSDIDAAMLWSALQHMDHIQNTRLAVWDAYDHKLLCPPNCVYNKPSKKLRANAHMYFSEFNDPEMRTILVATHYVPLDVSPFIEDQRSKNLLPAGEPCVQATKWSKSLVRLPLYADLSTQKVKKNNYCHERVCCK